MAELKAGMKVRHKSGGPLMIVERIGTDSWTGQPKVWCEWFDSAGYRHHETFVPEVLEEAADGSAAPPGTASGRSEGIFDPQQ
jgi:uncharacterized protein YodC (DUF2158 family)